MMITAIVRFPLPQGLTLEDVKSAYEHSAPPFQEAPGLVCKDYLHGVDGMGGGMYLWQSREAAEAMYSDDWRQRIAGRFGAPPTIEYFDTPLIIDNAKSAG